jgi:hypothetical protein
MQAWKKFFERVTLSTQKSAKISTRITCFHAELGSFSTLTLDTFWYYYILFPRLRWESWPVFAYIGIYMVSSYPKNSHCALQYKREKTQF